MISPLDPVDQPTPLNEAVDVASRLSDRDKIRLITQVSAQLERKPRFDRDFTASGERSLLGALAHLGPVPSPENIDEARRDMLANFPREELAP